jgi:hypothetical protein
LPQRFELQKLDVGLSGTSVNDHARLLRIGRKRYRTRGGVDPVARLAQHPRVDRACSSPRSMPRGSRTIGLFVERLDELLQLHRGEEDFRNGQHWLQP